MTVSDFNIQLLPNDKSSRPKKKKKPKDMQELIIYILNRPNIFIEHFTQTKMNIPPFHHHMKIFQVFPTYVDIKQVLTDKRNLK